MTLPAQRPVELQTTSLERGSEASMAPTKRAIGAQRYAIMRSVDSFPSSAARWLAVAVLIGVVTLLASFAINPGPPPGSSLQQMTTFGFVHAADILLGGWMQMTGTALAIVFALGLVWLTQSTARLDGLLTLLGCAVLLAVSLAELAGYALVTSGDLSVVRVGAPLIAAVQRGYSVLAAPLVFAPLGALLLRSGLLGRPLAYGALVLAALFWLLGLANSLIPLQALIDILSAFQGLWWLWAGLALLRRASLRSPPLP